MADEASPPGHLQREELGTDAKPYLRDLATQVADWVADGKDLQNLPKEDLSAIAPLAQQLTSRSELVFTPSQFLLTRY